MQHDYWYQICMVKTDFTVQKSETYFQLNSSKLSINYTEKLIQRTFYEPYDHRTTS